MTMRQVSPQVALLKARGSLQQHGVRLAEGANPVWQSQLAEKSQQPHICQLPPEDPESLAARGEVAQFIQQGHIVHWLISKDDDVAGTIFYKKQSLQYNQSSGLMANRSLISRVYTRAVAIRLYEGYLDHGFARPFMLTSLALHVRRLHDCGERVGGLWLQINTEQVRTINMLKRFGYQEIAGDASQAIMVLPPVSVLKLTGAVQPEDATG